MTDFSLGTVSFKCVYKQNYIDRVKILKKKKHFAVQFYTESSILPSLLKVKKACFYYKTMEQNRNKINGHHYISTAEVYFFNICFVNFYKAVYIILLNRQNRGWTAKIAEVKI